MNINELRDRVFAALDDFQISHGWNAFYELDDLVNEYRFRRFHIGHDGEHVYQYHSEHVKVALARLKAIRVQMYNALRGNHESSAVTGSASSSNDFSALATASGSVPVCGVLEQEVLKELPAIGEQEENQAPGQIQVAAAVEPDSTAEFSEPAGSVKPVGFYRVLGSLKPGTAIARVHSFQAWRLMACPAFRREAFQ